MKTFIFDTETDGLSNNSAMRIDKQPHVTELFGLTLNENMEEIGVWQSLFKQVKPLPDKIIQITGITDELLMTAPWFKEKALEIKEHIESHDTIVGHNLHFDMERIENEMERAGIKIVWPKNLICTIEQTEHIKGFRLSLTALHEYLFGEGFPNAHRAEPDVRALTKCYIELVKRGEI